MYARHRKFALEYVKCGFVGVTAVYAAGYKQGYNAAKVTASRLLTKANIKKMIDDTIEKAQIDAELTAERTSKEIARTAYAEVPGADFNSQLSAKMKALDLATKILGMQSTKVETVDLTAQNAAESALLKSIENAAKRDDCAPESAAVQLFQALQDDPQFRDVQSWPAKYRDVILQSQSSQQVTEIQGEQ